MKLATTSIASLTRENLALQCDHQAPHRWLLRIAVFLLVLGTAKYAERDSFHQDESILQPMIEVTAVVLGTLLALGTAFHYRTRTAVGWPYVLLILTLALAI